jgi:hypothetical protein
MPKRKAATSYQPPSLNLNYSPLDDVALERVISAISLEARPSTPGAQKLMLLRLTSASILLRNNQRFTQGPVPPTAVDSFNRSDRRR